MTVLERRQRQLERQSVWSSSSSTAASNKRRIPTTKATTTKKATGISTSTSTWLSRSRYWKKLILLKQHEHHQQQRNWRSNNKNDNHNTVKTNNMFKNSNTKLVAIDASTLGVIKLEVEDLWRVNHGQNHDDNVGNGNDPFLSFPTPTTTTLLAMANALLGSRNLLDIHAEAILLIPPQEPQPQRSYLPHSTTTTTESVVASPTQRSNTPPTPTNTSPTVIATRIVPRRWDGFGSTRSSWWSHSHDNRTRIRTGHLPFRSLSVSSWTQSLTLLASATAATANHYQRTMDTEQTMRRYSLVNALQRLQQQPGAASKVIATWEDAIVALSTVLLIPPDEYYYPHTATVEDSETVDNAHTKTGKNPTDATGMVVATVNTTTTTTTSNHHNNVDTVDHFLQRLRDIRLEEVSPPGLRVSQHKWLDVAAAAATSLDETKDHVTIPDGETKRRRDEASTQATGIITTDTKEAAAAVTAWLRPLSSTELQRIKDALHHAGDSSGTTAPIAVSDTDTCQWTSLQTLLPHEWLNDEVIHCYLALLQQRDEELCRNVATNTTTLTTTTNTNGHSTRRRSHFFKSFFCTKLLDEGNANPALNGMYNYANVKRWSKKVPGKDIFKLDKIFFPINQGNQHWTSAVAFMQEKRIQYYDSMGGSGIRYLQNLLHYLQDEHLDKKGSKLDIDQWTLIACTSDTPRQRNGYDCGVFTCMFADFISRDWPLHSLHQDDMPHCRERMALAILNCHAAAL